MIEDINYEARILKARRYFFALSTISVLVPLLSYFGFFKPESELLGNWFQRSGSVMVVFALFAEMRAYEMFDVLKPAAMVSNEFGYVHQKYKDQIKIFSIFALILVAIGTVIWGYGDLFIKEL